MTTLNSVNLFNPIGSASGQVPLSTGPNSPPAWGNVSYNNLLNVPTPQREIILAGTGFTAGTSTSITLSGTYGSVNNIVVHFDAFYQSITSIASLIGKVLTFNTPIPIGVSTIYIDSFGVATTTTNPPIASVGVAQLATDALNYFAPASSTQFTQNGTGAVAYPISSKLKQIVSVTDFGAACNGTTDDTVAINAAYAYLKANGGGELYFPGFSLLTSTLYLTGSVTGGSGNNNYPIPNQPKITLRGNGNSGIISNITSGSVISFSSPTATLNHMVGFKDIVIDCGGNNVIGVNGMASCTVPPSVAGVYGYNHYTDMDGLMVHGVQGANAIGIDFGTITDSRVVRTVVQGFGTQPYAGMRINKTDVQLIDCRVAYCTYGIVVGILAEACIQMTGGSIQSSGVSSIYYESPTADYKSSSSVLSGVFIGENTAGAAIMQANSPFTLDTGTTTFIGCEFDNYRPGQDLINMQWGGRYTFIGCGIWSGSTGLSSINFGQYCYVLLQNSPTITVNSSSQALANGQVNIFPVKTNVPFTPALAATGSTFSYASQGQVGFYTKILNEVTVTIRIQLATTGNTLTANNLTITNLPYPVCSNAYGRASLPVIWFSFNTALINAYGLALEGSNSITLYKVTSASTSAFTNTMQASDLSATAGSGIEVTFTYFTNN